MGRAVISRVNTRRFGSRKRGGARSIAVERLFGTWTWPFAPFICGHWTLCMEVCDTADGQSCRIYSICLGPPCFLPCGGRCVVPSEQSSFLYNLACTVLGTAHAVGTLYGDNTQMPMPDLTLVIIPVIN
jgi:hypothetical protein